MLNIALPLAGAAYARSGLSTLQHLLVPIGLRSSGLTARDALAGYGIIQGMALPVVLFPSCVMLAVAELIVPKLTRSQVAGADEDIRVVTVDLLQKSMIFSVGAAALLLALGDSLGIALYNSAEAGLYIQIFALIVPVMMTSSMPPMRPMRSLRPAALLRSCTGTWPCLRLALSAR